MNAAKIAGLNPLRMICESTSAALACGFHKFQEEKKVLVFDFGGGTFDSTVLTIDEDILSIEATRGDMMLGGRDLDQILVNICEEKIME